MRSFPCAGYAATVTTLYREIGSSWDLDTNIIKSNWVGGYVSVKVPVGVGIVHVIPTQGTHDAASGI